MKLVIATPLYPPDIGGPATYAALLSKGLVEKGHTVSLVKFGDVRHLPKIIRHIAYYYHVAHALKSADIVLALDPVSVGLPVCIAARRMKKPMVVKIVGDYAWEQGMQRFGISMSLDKFVNIKRIPLRVWFLRKVQTRVAKSSKLIIVPSEYLKKIICTWGIADNAIHVIYNAISGGEEGTVPQQISTLPRPFIISSGRLVPWKHMDGIINAVALLRERGTYISLVILGDGNERSYLESLAKETLKDGYCFTGSVSHPQLLATMHTADMFILNSSYEGLSHTLIEALSCAIPIIATRVGGNEEVLNGYSGAKLVSGGDVNELADAIEHVIQKKDMRQLLQPSATKLTKRFSQDTMTNSTIEALSKLI